MPPCYSREERRENILKLLVAKCETGNSAHEKCHFAVTFDVQRLARSDCIDYSGDNREDGKKLVEEVGERERLDSGKSLI